MEKFLSDTGARFVGLRIEALQKALNISPSESDTDPGWTHQKWDDWTNGTSLPDISDMSALTQHYEVTLDYIYRGNLSSVPDWISKRIRAVVAQDPRIILPHWTRTTQVRLISKWRTDQDHRFIDCNVEGGILRDQLGFGVHFPYSPIGRTRWELCNASPDLPFWQAHIATIENREAVNEFSYNVKFRSGRRVRVAISGWPNFRRRHFVGYTGIGRLYNIDQVFHNVA